MLVGQLAQGILVPGSILLASVPCASMVVHVHIHTYDLKPLAGFGLNPRIPDKGIEMQKRRIVKL